MRLWSNTPVPTSVDSAFDRLLSNLNRYLRPHGFRRSGQRFGRDTGECWQVIGFQKSRYSDTGEIRFTVNFGVTPKALMAFRGEDVSRMPLDWKCPIRYRIGEFLGVGDCWWSSNEGDDFRTAFTAITSGLSERALPFLNGLDTDRGLLALYQTGRVDGFEIDRDETRAILAAHLGLNHEASQRLHEYEGKWVPGPTSKRATAFIGAYRDRFRFAGE